MSSSSSLADPSLLEKIDKLFTCNVGEYVDLPQIVVVGDQSSGKSSVLEALTCLPFPRESSLCTRFATKITFRRSARTSITASVVPAKESGEEHQRIAREWKKEDLRELDPATFAAIMGEVNDVMEFKSDPHGARSQFSTDVLSLEISGPNQEHLSVIDVPGLFQRHKEGVTTKADIDLVKRMVYGYMGNHRSVMLTVIPSNSDIANQGILEKAEELDADGIRTLGVLTKPDLVDKGAEHNVEDLINGREHQLRLGWHLLRNAGQSELSNSIADRQEAERTFFATAEPWKNLDKDKVGISSFRTRLQEVLSDHIYREFPKVKAEIGRRLKHCHQNLQHLGAKRQTSEEQRQYLIEIAMNYQKVVAEALTTNYGRREMFKEHPSLRLVTTAVNRSEIMSHLMATKGHMFHFEGNATVVQVVDDVAVIGDSNNQTEAATRALEDVAGLFQGENGTETTDQKAKATTDVRMYPNHPDIADILPQTSNVADPERGTVFPWLQTTYRESRGFEIGTFNPSLLGTIIKEQCQKWQDLSLGYVADVIVLTHTFVNDLLALVCPVKRVRDGILNLIMDKLTSKYKKAIQQVRFLLDVDLNGTPSTLNHYFNDNLQKCRQQRMRNRIKEKTLSDCKHGEVVRVGDLYHHSHMSNDDHTIQDLHDILQSYYKVARKRFVDTLRTQAVDYYLISGKDTPLTLFSPAFVAEMTPEELDEAAGEDRQVKRQRAALEKEAKDLEQAKKILR